MVKDIKKVRNDEFDKTIRSNKRTVFVRFLVSSLSYTSTLIMFIYTYYYLDQNLNKAIVFSSL
jgi:hypothetical protein